MAVKVLAFFLLLLTISLTVFADSGKVEAIGAFTDPGASESLKKALEPKGYRVSLADGTVLCEIWLRSAVGMGRMTRKPHPIPGWLTQPCWV
jgi:hypothetical protein